MCDVPGVVQNLALAGGPAGVGELLGFAEDSQGNVRNELPGAGADRAEETRSLPAEAPAPVSIDTQSPIVTNLAPEDGSTLRNIVRISARNLTTAWASG